MLAGGWTAAMALVAASEASDLSATITCGVAAAVAVFGGMFLFERLIGTPGAAVGAGIAPAADPLTVRGVRRHPRLVRDGGGS
jgi:hypothetical protein